MEKNIKSSRRGLTFSFLPTGRLDIGSHYDYIIANGSIRIVSSQTGRYKVSRKKGKCNSWTPLIDLRNQEIRDTIAGMEEIRLHITENEIFVSDARTSVKGKGKILVFPRQMLAHARHVSGLSDSEAAARVLDSVQLTFDDYLASFAHPMDVAAVHKDLSDVYSVVSLFSGAGVLDWPFFTDERFNIQYAIDYDAGACETYRHNIGMHIVHGDIHKAFTSDGYSQDSLVSNPDVIIGGPSCKPFSNSNRHTRLQDHPDSDLLMQYMRIVQKLRPKVWAIENVPEVLTACDGTYFSAVQDVAKKAGYETCSKIIQDCKVGGYTTRKRAIIIGSRIGTPSFPELSLEGKPHTVSDAFHTLDASCPNYYDVSVSSPEVVKRMSFVPQGGNYTSIPEEYRTGSKNRHSCTYRRLALDEPSPTLVNWRKPPLIHPTENRTLTVAEAKVLQGLPKQFRVCGTLGQMQQQIGNCVPVAIGQFIKHTLLRILGFANSSPCAASI